MIYKHSAKAGAKHGGVAQLGERTVRIRKVESSILFVSTKKTGLHIREVLFFSFCFEKRIETSSKRDASQMRQVWEKAPGEPSSSEKRSSSSPTIKGISHP